SGLLVFFSLQTYDITKYELISNYQSVILLKAIFSIMGNKCMEENIVFLLLASTLILFIWGKIRYDFIALAILFALSILRIIPVRETFSGFGHPAVITVAAVMIVSQGLQNSGLIDLIARWLEKLGKNNFLQTSALCTVTGIASAFMNNVGAIAIMMPVAIKLSNKNNNPPSHILMPLAFSSILGGMMTLIGTPPNIIISTFRNNATGSPFKMFDFMPVGIFITIVGIAFVSIIGWRLLPKRKAQNGPDELFNIDDYITEVRVLKNSNYRGKKLRDIKKAKNFDINILGLIRNKRRIHTPELSEELKVNDILIFEADSENLKEFTDITGFKLLGGKQFRKDAAGSKDISNREVVVINGSKILGKTAADLNLRSRYGINLLAVARADQQIKQRLDHIKFQVGDVLLLQGRTQVLDETISNIGVIPLEERGLRIGYQKRIIMALSIFITAIIITATGILHVSLSFSIAALLLVLTGIIPFRDVYKDIDWAIIILLGAMLPVGNALELSGGANTIAEIIMSWGTGIPVWLMLTIIMVITMLLSNVINNAATAVLMAPIGIIIAQNTGVSVDLFLMSIAIGASSPFLTPIGHQSNTLVMAPGGYKFSDYWRMGLPLQILIVIIAIPIIMLVWSP
ncbi:MAG: SLC13 family permease, partial [Atribacterota bacterium]